MAFTSLATSLYMAGQLPLDSKTYFNSLAEMKSLGLNNHKAFYYYDYMNVLCRENGQRYVWKEVDESYTGGVLDENFLYPANTVTEGLDYSGKYYNFVEEVKSTNNVVGKPFIIFKHPGNDMNNEYLEVNDVAYGYLTENLFIEARYKGGPVTSATSWAIMRDRDPLSYT